MLGRDLPTTGLSTEVETCLRRGRPSMEGEARVQRGETCLQRGETCLQRVRLVYGVGDSSTEGETRLQRGRLV